jgi:hypothetical protein
MLQPRQRRDDVGRGDPPDRRDQRIQRILGDTRCDLRPEAGRARRFMDDHAAARAPDRFEDRLGVVGFERREIENFSVDALAGERLRRSQAIRRRRAPGDDGQVAPRPQGEGRIERQSVPGLVDRFTPRAV